MLKEVKFMDLLIEGIGRGIASFLRWIFVTAIVDSILYGLGYVVVKVMSLGKYPASNRDNQSLCVGTGLISFVVIVALIALYNAN